MIFRGRNIFYEERTALLRIIFEILKPEIAEFENTLYRECIIPLRRALLSDISFPNNLLRNIKVRGPFFVRLSLARMILLLNVYVNACSLYTNDVPL